MIARMVLYSGRVQGVGFRYTTVKLARNWSVTGWVKNLPDRRVQLLVEGEEPEVTGFLQAVRDHWQDYLRDERIETQVATGDYKDFTVAT